MHNMSTTSQSQFGRNSCARSICTRFVLSLQLLILSSIFADNAIAKPLQQRVRRPIAMVATADRLYVANERGSLSVVDTKSGAILAEHDLGQPIVHMIEFPTRGKKNVPQQAPRLLLLCPETQQLILATVAAKSIKTQVVGQVDRSAIRLLADERHSRVFVSEKWARRVVALEIDTTKWRVKSRQIGKLDFAPQELQLLHGTKLAVADAFGGQIGILETASLKTSHVATIKGHNIRGLGLNEDGSSLLVAQQRMNPLARADYDDLHWGALVSNGVRVLDVSELSATRATPPTVASESTVDRPTKSVGQIEVVDVEGWLDQFGGTGSAMGDASGMITGEHELMAVTFGGIGEVIIRRAGYSTRIAVGRRPGAMAVHIDRLYIANQFDDSISFVDLDVGKVTQTVSLGPAAKLTPTDRGELLFFNAKLSHDGWISCHSCHTDGHSSGLLIDTLGDGDYGAPKRIPSLLGTRGTGPWAWNGGMKTLADQVRKSVSTTMHGEELSDSEVNDLVAFLESLKPPPPAVPVSAQVIAQGRSIFESNNCHQCHAGNTLTTAGVFDVGLVDENKHHTFNPPSLRGVGQRSRLFHDGRAKSVEDVVSRFRHRLKEPLKRDDSEALLAYLKSL